MNFTFFSSAHRTVWISFHSFSSLIAGIKIPKLCWIVVLRVATLVLFLTLGEILFFFFSLLSMTLPVWVFHVWPLLCWYIVPLGFPGSTDGKESACQCRRHQKYGFSSGLGRSPGVGSGNPLQYSCLENSMDRGAWQAIVYWVAKSWI